ncbi:MAG: tetratricopeptide repeat protein [Spirochaetota bacterium]
MKTIIAFLVYSIIASPLSADSLIDLSKIFLKNKEYYHAITECMRYQYCYPDGTHYPESMLIMSQAYFLGGNYYRATDIAYQCYQKFSSTPWGQVALYNLATMRLLEGSAFFAYRNFQEYFSMYPEGILKEQAMLNFIYTKAALHYYTEVENDLQEFIASSADESLVSEAIQFAKAFNDYQKRPKKKVWLSVTGSLVFPGFGHFYAGNYSIGILSFISTATCAALAYRGYAHDNNFQLVFFGLAGFTFYQYSLVSAVTNVYEYNTDTQLKESIRLSVLKRF